ncbi:MAG: HAMP domain-containing protein [Treponema sp.]|jgi:adenylate cyclase|nr:HAMP domain-containing protein [Treponema sp.]
MNKKIIRQEVSENGVFFFADRQPCENGGGEELIDYGRFITTQTAESVPAAAAFTVKAAPSGKSAPGAAGQRGTEPGPVGVVFPIGLKMAGMITLILFVSLGLITALVWFFIRSSEERTALENNLGINNSSFMTTETILNSVSTGVSLLWHNLGPGASQDQIIKLFFENHKDIAGLSFSSTGKESWKNSLFVNESFFRNHELNPSLIFARQNLFPWNREQANSGGMDLFNGAFFFNGVPILVIRFVLPENPADDSATVFFSSGELIDAFGIGANTSFLVSSTGDLLIHPDRDMIRNSVNLAYDPLVRDILNDGKDRSRADYKDLGGTAWFAAARRIAEGDAFIVTRIPQDVVFEGITATTRRNLYLSLGVWFLGVLILWFLAKPISEVLGKLKEAAEAIEDGRYYPDLRGKSRDETGVLAESMNSMSNVLDNFEKFTNKYLARLARKGRLAPGGVDREATVFFSDIRSFTAISEKLSPQEVLEFLNDYMERMVACVINTGGVIDKFIGDAVMAHWGAVESAGSSARDALNAVRAVLMMRASLANFNRGRGGEKRPLIRIGCGLNTGHLVAGQIGSDERLEYTVIGETVSLADKTETLNKIFGTEILITENTWRLVRDHFITEEMPSVTANGKGVRIFAVINAADPEEAEGLLMDAAKIPKTDPETNRRCLGPAGPQNLKELRALLKIEAPDLKNLNLKGEEKKYRITEKNLNQNPGPRENRAEKYL